MRKLFTFLLFFSISFLTINAQCGNLYIGGVIDGDLSGGNPKGVQFCATADIADLSIYGFGSANNGGGTDGQEFTFPAESVLAGSCFWVGASTSGWAAFFGYEPCYTSGAANINGDDAIELFCSGALEDVYGDQNVDGTGQCWEHSDGWAVNNSGGPSTTFDCANWTIANSALDGETTNASAANPYPNDTQTCPVVATPIELASFSATKNENSVLLSWSTISEVNNELFQVEYSRDGIDYRSIGELSGAGTSTKTNAYSFIHTSPAKGNNYYRLRQIDYSREFSFSEVALVKWGTQGNLEVYPTLVQNFATIVLEKGNAEKEITLFDFMGRVIQNWNTTASGNMEIDLAGIAPGTYLISINSNGSRQTAKIIKQ